MKLLPAILLLFLSSLHAQETPAADKVPAGQTTLKNEFLNLPEEKRKEFSEKYAEASKFFQQKSIFECLEAIDEAEKIFPNSSELLNLRGSCYVEIRSFDKATEAFTKAAEIAPENPIIRFNIAEVLFVTNKWKEALDMFESILGDVTKNSMSLSRLIEFKILLCKLKLGEEDEVQILAEKYDYQDDSPFYYYAKAALAYHKDNPVEAEQWIARAMRIFTNPTIISPWQDTLVEFGYIKGLYGEEPPLTEE